MSNLQKVALKLMNDFAKATNSSQNFIQESNRYVGQDKNGNQFAIGWL